MKTTFLVIHKPGPSRPSGAPVSALPLKEHGKYMLSLYSNGKMKSAGPFADHSGAAIMLEVTDESEA